jgi:alpha-ribazole phosphatase
VLLAKHLGVPCQSDARLMELSFGAWEGKSWYVLFATRREALDLWAADPLGRRPEGGESGRELEHRVQSFLAEVAGEGDLLVTHAGVIRALLVLSRRLPWAHALGGSVPYLEPIPFDVDPLPRAETPARIEPWLA